MKRETQERIFTGLWAWVMASAISVSGVFCMVSGFRMENVDAERLILGCVGFSALGAIAYSFRFGGLGLLGAGIGVGIFSWDALAGSVRLLAENISRIYDKAYRWGYLEWAVPGEFTPEEALLALGFLAALGVSFTVCRRKRAVAALAVPVLMVISCFVVTDTVPDKIWLFLLVVAAVLLILTNQVRRRDGMDGSRLTALMLVPVVLAGGLLFAVVPEKGFDFQNWDVQMSAPGFWEEIRHLFDKTPPQLNFAWESRSVSLAHLGSLPEFGQDALYVKADFSDVLYLRGQAFDRYTGRDWKITDAEDGPDDGWTDRRAVPLGRVEITTAGPRRNLYFPVYPGESLVKFGYERKDGAYRSRGDNYVIPVYSAGITEQRNMLVGLQENYTQLPEETRRYAEALVQSFAGEEKNTAQMANKIRQFVSQSARYSREVETMPRTEKDFVRWFLEDADRGYCVHFATAATVLLRAAGIPARYVTGYTARVTAGKSVTIPESQAHAWVEYYDAGWRILDPTPGESSSVIPEPVQTEPTVSKETEPVDPVETDPTEPKETEPAKPIETDPTEPAETQPQTSGSSQTEPSEETATEPLPEKPSEPQEPGENPIFGILGKILPWLGAVAGILGAAWLQYRARLAHYQSRRRQGSCNQQALYLWRRCDRIAKAMQQIPPKKLRELAEKAKFSQHMLTKEELSAFDDYLEELHRRRSQKPWLWQVCFQLIWAVE